MTGDPGIHRGDSEVDRDSSVPA